MKSVPSQVIKTVTVIAIMGIFLFPFWWMMVTALKTSREILQFPPSLFPELIDFNNFISVFKRVPLLTFMKNSLITAFGVTFLAVFVSSLGGYIFAKFEFRGKNYIFLFILSTIMVPLTVIIIPLYLMVIGVGLKNTLIALIIPCWANALGIFLIRNYLGSLPNSYIESARIDGCREFAIFRRIILPLIKPALAAIFIFIFMNNWDSFLWPLIVIDETSLRTLPLGLGLFTQAFGVQSWNLIMSATLVSIIPIFIVFIFFRRFFIEGITLSGLKG
jgi:ABC-type glycerol-3-phosphate transport system permease component